MFTLYIDESGKSYLRGIDASRPHFTFAGVITKSEVGGEEIRKLADQIKFKYWGKTDVVFHAADLLHLKGIYWRFNIKNKKPSPFTIEDFYKDFLRLLSSKEFYIGITCLNKLKFLQLPQNKALAQAVLEVQTSPIKIPNYDTRFVQIINAEKKIVKRGSEKLLLMYLHLLVENGTYGQIVVEATGDPQDLLIFSAYNNLLSVGYPPLNMKGEDIRRYFTSISFATKNNHDIETQLADAAAVFLNLQERKVDGLSEDISPMPEHAQIIQAFKDKSFDFVEDSTKTTHPSIERFC